MSADVLEEYQPQSGSHEQRFLQLPLLGACWDAPSQHRAAAVAAARNLEWQALHAPASSHCQACRV
eukprot:176892-Chlamydomonas_euryale.AAC.1